MREIEAVAEIVGNRIGVAEPSEGRRSGSIITTSLVEGAEEPDVMMAVASSNGSPEAQSGLVAVGAELPANKSISPIGYRKAGDFL